MTGHIISAVLYHMYELGCLKHLRLDVNCASSGRIQLRTCLDNELLQLGSYQMSHCIDSDENAALLHKLFLTASIINRVLQKRRGAVLEQAYHSSDQLSILKCTSMLISDFTQ